VWSYRSLHEMGSRRAGSVDWLGNITLAVGLSILLAGITYGIQPYGGHATGWTNPWVLGGVGGGLLLLAVFCAVETRVADPMFRLALCSPTGRSGWATWPGSWPRSVAAACSSC